MPLLSQLVAQARAAHHAGDLPRASDLYRQAIARDANHVPALHGAALLAYDVGYSGPALEYISRAAVLAPDNPEIHHDRGLLLARAGRRPEAIAAFRRALALNPDHPGTHANLGTLLLFEDLSTQAMAHFQIALALDPRHAPAQHNLAHALLAQGRHREALQAFGRAIELEPHNPEPPQNRLYALLCADGITPKELAAAHAAWAARHAPPQPAPAWTNTPDKHRRLRVGYLSPDFRGHSVASFIAPVLTHHDRTQVEVFCYADVPTPDATTARLQTLAEHWHPVASLSDAKLAALIRSHAIDVLVDLAGHSRHNRLRLFAARLAPVQATYLGYPFATGLASMDLRLTDAIADPPGSDFPTLETLHRLPAPFLAFEPPINAPPVSSLPIHRNGHITFGSFNHTAKLTTTTLDLWSSLLRAIPASRLVLKAWPLKDAGLRDHLVAAFDSRGITPERLTLLPPTASQTDHLTAYHNLDIALDTFPYHGTTTTCEALYMGVPVISLEGDGHHSRTGATLLAAMGLGHLSVTSPALFLERAMDLAHDISALALLRAGLRARLAASPLCDAKRLAAGLEAAFRQAWHHWCNGLSPRTPMS